MNVKINGLEKNIGYNFKDKLLLKRALTHSSYANEVKHTESNERLEFLGDSVLSVIVSDYLFKNYKKYPEGELTKQRAALVCEKALSAFARQIKLGDYLILGRGETQNHGSERASILADAFEAVLAAIYLDGGIEPASKFVLGFVLEELNEHIIPDGFVDYKTQLQEVIQQNPQENLQYVLVGESGPDHDKSFTVDVMLNSNMIGRGTGRSKKNAEQEAAKQALSLMGIKYD